MLSFFPEPYPDELLYDLFSRYHKRSGNISMFDTLIELFGTKNALAVMDFPSKLQHLCSQLMPNSDLNPQYLINNHTTFPFYRPFLHKDRIKNVIDDMRGNGGKAIHMRLGIMAGGILKTKGFKYCLKCIDEDRHKYGEAYIHRMHQVPGIFFCLEHNELLKEYSISNEISQFRFLHLDDCLLHTDAEEKSFMQDPALNSIASDIYYLFNNDLSNIDFNWVWEKIYVRLGEKDFLHTKGKIKIEKIANEFLEFYTPELLKKLESYFELDIKPNWFYNMISDRRHAAHPIRQLLLIRFLFGSMESLISNGNFHYHPFGQGPWPCLNIAADHYKKDAVYKCELSTHRGKPVGRFSCECGFIYTRKGPDTSFEDRYKIGCKKEFGTVWEAVLKEKVISGNFSIDRLSKMMACDTSTIIKYADKLGVKDYLNTKAKVRKDKPQRSHVNYKLEAVYKRDIRELVENNPNLSRSEISELLGKQYAWLSDNHREWFDNIMPKPYSQIKSNTLGTGKVNWDQRDLDIYESVSKVVDDILMENKLIRITISYISRQIGYRPLFEHLDRLPLTRALILEKIETYDKFHIRKINSVVEKLRSEGNLKKWKIIWVCGLKTRSKMVDSYINQLLE